MVAFKLSKAIIKGRRKTNSILVWKNEEIGFKKVMKIKKIKKDIAVTTAKTE